MPLSARKRGRISGAVDTNIGDATNPALLIPLVTGRFYDSTQWIGAITSTITMGVYADFVPILIPHPVVVTAIGVESTVGSSAGGLLRFAIYDSDPVDGLPRFLRVDGGTTASDATGFLSVSISTALKAGWHWLAAVNNGSPTSVTVRASGANQAAMAAYQTASAMIPNLQMVQGMRMNNASGLVTAGFPYRFPATGLSMQWLGLDAGATQFPRVMIGV